MGMTNQTRVLFSCISFTSSKGLFLQCSTSEAIASRECFSCEGFSLASPSSVLKAFSFSVLLLKRLRVWSVLVVKGFHMKCLSFEAFASIECLKEMRVYCVGVTFRK